MRKLLALAALGAGALALSCSHEKPAQKETPAPVMQQPAPPPTVIPPEEKQPIVFHEVERTESIYFDFDKSEIRDDAHLALASIAQAFMAKPADAVLTIVGNCDERGTREYNQALGERRASAARDYLVELGIPIHRITTVSYGEDRPVALGHDEDSWARNRRADMNLRLEPEVGPIGVR